MYALLIDRLPPYFQAGSPARFLMRPRYSPLDAGRMESTARA